MSGRWDQAKILKLIQLYQENECLWNTKSVFYKKETARDNAYKRMIQGMGDQSLTKMSLQQKIQNLRNIYVHEFQKVRDTNGTYKPKLVWYDEMDFLANYIEENYAIPTEISWLGSPSSSVPIEDILPINDDCNAVFIKDECSDIDEAELVEKTLEQPSEEDISHVTKFSQNDYLESLVDGPSSKRKRCETDDFAVPRISITHGNLKKGLFHEDEFYYFGLSVAAQMRNMPLEHALQMQAKIQSLLTNDRCQMLQKDYSSAARTSNLTALSEDHELCFEKQIGNSAGNKSIAADIKSPNKQMISSLHSITENQVRMQTQLSLILGLIDQPRDAVSDKIMRQNLNIAKETFATVKKLFGTGSSTADDEIAAFFPLSNSSELEQIEQKIQDKSIEDALKTFLIQKRGYQSLDNLLRNLITDDLLDAFNWDGRLGKRALKSVRLFGVILSDVFCQLNKKEFEAEIRKAIELSHNRAKQKRMKCIITKNLT